VIVASASVSGLGSSSDVSVPRDVPNSFAFDLVEQCDDFTDARSWSQVAQATGGIDSMAVSTRFSLAATACSRLLDSAANAAADGIKIEITAASERLVQVTQTE
jgi:hypothetical protein